jgi:hypothetical protein
MTSTLHERAIEITTEATASGNSDIPPRKLNSQLKILLSAIGVLMALFLLHPRFNTQNWEDTGEVSIEEVLILGVIWVCIGSLLALELPTLAAYFTYKRSSPSPLPTFALYQQLPMELQLQIIKHAWHNELSTCNRDIIMLCRYQRHPQPQFLDHTISSGATRLPNLALANKQFLAECRFLAWPHLLDDVLIGGKRRQVPFISELNSLRLQITRGFTGEYTILEYLDKLPDDPWADLNHLKLECTGREAVELFEGQCAYQNITEMVLAMDLPLLESVTIMGINWWNLTAMDEPGPNDPKFQLNYPSREGGTVTVEWDRVEEFWTDAQREARQTIASLHRTQIRQQQFQLWLLQRGFSNHYARLLICSIVSLFIV